MPEVRHYHHKHFLDELRRDAALLDRKIVRLALLQERGQLPVALLVVVASYHLQDVVVKLRLVLGDVWGVAAQDAVVQARADKLMAELLEAFAALELDVREGVVSPGLTERCDA